MHSRASTVAQFTTPLVLPPAAAASRAAVELPSQSPAAPRPSPSSASHLAAVSGVYVCVCVCVRVCGGGRTGDYFIGVVRLARAEIRWRHQLAQPGVRTGHVAQLRATVQLRAAARGRIAGA